MSEMEGFIIGIIHLFYYLLCIKFQIVLSVCQVSTIIKSYDFANLEKHLTW